jgi:hypothetical protein
VRGILQPIAGGRLDAVAAIEPKPALQLGNARPRGRQW